MHWKTKTCGRGNISGLIVVDGGLISSGAKNRRQVLRSTAGNNATYTLHCCNRILSRRPDKLVR